MGNGFSGWFARSAKVIIVVLVGIMAAALVVLAQQNVQATAPGAGRTAGPIPTFTSAARVQLQEIPARPKVLIIGDSYTEGYGTTNGATFGWAPVISRDLNWDSTIDGVGNTGYSAGGAPDGSGDRNFRDRLAKHKDLDPDLVFMQGGQNDYHNDSPQLVKDARDTFKQIKQQWPNAAIVALGPSLPVPAANNAAPISDAIGVAARQENVHFISALNEGWLTAQNSPGYSYTDGHHLNNDGAAYLAKCVETALKDTIKQG
jgi:acyl-CoA thioesterase-1